MLSIPNSLRSKLLEEAMKSPQKEKHAAIITQGKKIICSACNTPRSHFKNIIHSTHQHSNSICFGHAEINAINKFMSLYGYKSRHCFLQLFSKEQKI